MTNLTELNEVKISGIMLATPKGKGIIGTGSKLVVDWDGRRNVTLLGFMQIETEDGYNGLVLSVKADDGLENVVGFDDVYDIIEE